MSSLSKIIESKAASWCSTEKLSLSDINNGLCADFANAVDAIFEGLRIVGVYDIEDLKALPKGHSSDFYNAVSQDHIGHTALFFEGLFFDCECAAGCSRFEDLPVNKRGMAESAN